MSEGREIRCYWCNVLIIEAAAAPWRYTCRKCRGRESSTGIVALPRDSRHAAGFFRRAS